jgi:oxaloacetate decarboxylase alpha subunit
LPGGVLTTTRRQLAELGKAALLPRVIEEAVRVREDLGWPIVVTPFAQYIVTQASINVITGDRYSRITDEIVELLRGDFGPMPGKISEDLLERASRAPRARQPRSSDDEPSLNDIRRKFGTGLSDEDLLLRAVMPAEQVDAMTRRRAAGNNGLNTLLDALRDDSRPLSISMHICGATFSASGNKEGRLDA